MSVLTTVRKIKENNINDILISAGLSITVAIIIALSQDTIILYKSAIYLGLIGLCLFLAIPNKRLLLIVGWILIHPLSIEKVFIIGVPILPEFLPPRIVLSASDILFFLLSFYILFESVFKKIKINFLTSPLLPFSLLVLFAILNFFINSHNLDSFLTVIHLIKMFLFLLIISISIRNKDELILILIAITIAIAFQVFLVLYAHFSPHIFHISSKISGRPLEFSGISGTYTRASGTVGHVNQEASYLILFSLPLIGLLGAKNGWIRNIISFLLFLTFLAIIFTYSRSAWVSSIIGITAMLVFSYKKGILKEKVWLYIFPILVIASIIFMTFHQSLLDRLLHGDEGATASRKRAIILAIDLFKKKPFFGVGPGNFVRASLKYYPPEKIKNKWMDPNKKVNPLTYRYGRLEINQVKVGKKIFVVPLPVHNKYLLILSELGLVGLFFFIWFLFRIFKYTFLCSKINDRILTFTCIGLIGAFWASLCYMNLDLFADDKTVEILFFVPALITALPSIIEKENSFIVAR